MNTFDELVSQIKQLRAKKSHVIVAISGFGGSGKSYLADRLRDYFNIKDDQIVRLARIGNR